MNSVNFKIKADVPDEQLQEIRKARICTLAGV